MNMAAITKNVFSIQFSISFLIMSCYLLKMTKKYSTPIWSRVLDFCDAAASILSTVFYLLKQVALPFVGTSTSFRMITAQYNFVGSYNQKLIRVGLMSPLSGGNG